MDVPRETLALTCPYCKLTWHPRVQKPRACPSCHKYFGGQLPDGTLLRRHQRGSRPRLFSEDWTNDPSVSEAAREERLRILEARAAKQSADLHLVDGPVLRPQVPPMRNMTEEEASKSPEAWLAYIQAKRAAQS